MTKSIIELVEQFKLNVHWDEMCKDWKIYKGTTLFAYDKDLGNAVIKAASKCKVDK